MSIRVNQISVKNWQNWLDLNHGPGKWVPITNFVALTQVTYNVFKKPVFDPNTGFPVVAFLNQQTGEVKMFDARRFYN